MKTIIPNTYLIGVQKAATTSFYNWLSQHPQICAPASLKDIAFFVKPELYKDRGIKYLSDRYKRDYKGEDIILQGCVHYVFFKEAIQRIKESNKDAKLILILRNPIERSLSAYHYAKKFNYENLPIMEAFGQESKRMQSNSILELSELTYVNHSLYYKQIVDVLEYFSREQLLVLFYENIKKNHEKELKKAFKFLNLQQDVEIDYKAYNNTGSVRNKTLQRVVFGDNPIRNFIVRDIVKQIVPENTLKKMRWKVMDLNTKQKKSNYLNEVNLELKKELLQVFKDDIENLELLLSEDLSHWKK